MNDSHTVDVRREDDFRVINIAQVKAVCERPSTLSLAADCLASSFFFLRCRSYSCFRRPLSSLNLDMNCSQPLRCSKGSHITLPMDVPLLLSYISSWIFLPFSLQRCPPPHRYQIVNEDQPNDGVFAVVCQFDPLEYGSLCGAAGLVTLFPRRPISQLEKIYKKQVEKNVQKTFRFEKEASAKKVFYRKTIFGCRKMKRRQH